MVVRIWGRDIWIVKMSGSILFMIFGSMVYSFWIGISYASSRSGNVHSHSLRLSVMVGLLASG